MVNALLLRLKNEPALVLSFLAAILQALEAEDVVTWNTVLTVVVGVAIRQLVTPTPQADADADAALDSGYVRGRAGLTRAGGRPLVAAPPEPGDFE